MALNQTPPCTLVIFGASGDLTQRKLIPALHSLDCEGLLPDNLQVLGVSRSELSDDDFRQQLRDGVLEHGRFKPRVWDKFAGRLCYMAGSYDDPETYRRLKERLDGIAAEKNTGDNVLFYLAIPPTVYSAIVAHLGQAGLNQSQGGWRRLIAEKPFGHDLQSARQLNDQIHAVLDETQVYRIDHYLGKETVQNIMTFRFANAIFEPLWNLKYVDHVQITVAESLGVGHRAEYYDQTGVLRDMFQNHLLQLLALTAMEPPAIWDADALRDEKVKVLRSIRQGPRSVRGRYEGYRQEPGVAADSQTATYAALQLFVDNWRWQNVPFYLRSGKCLATKASEVLVRFHHVPHALFPLPSGSEITANVLSLCIQPDEGMHLRFETKQPGAGMKTRSVQMDFHYSDDFEGLLPDAYERLLLDALQGDASLFSRADEIELAWQIIDPILESWQQPDGPALHIYEPGSWGPAATEELISTPGRSWLCLCSSHAEPGKKE